MLLLINHYEFLNTNVVKIWNNVLLKGIDSIIQLNSSSQIINTHFHLVLGFYAFPPHVGLPSFCDFAISAAAAAWAGDQGDQMSFL
jgi:hypothetical protein